MQAVSAYNLKPEFSLKFLHTSDWHLGMTRHFLKGEAQARFTQDRIDMIPALGKIAQEQDARFMVVCGDLFDANQVAPQTVVRSVEKLRRFPVPVFILPGNHDPLNAATVYNHPDLRGLPPHITVLRDSEIHQVPGVAGVEVVAAPWHHKQSLNDLCGQMLKTLTPVENGCIRIALAHGQLDSLMPGQNDPSAIDQSQVVQALADNRIQYLALGDRHSVTDADEVHGRIWYSGTPVATDFTERDPNQVLLVDASVGIDPRPRVEPIQVGQWRFESINTRVDCRADVDLLAQQLAAIDNKERTVIRLALQGSLRINENAALESVLESNRNLFASLRLHARQTDLAVVPDNIESEALALSGYARACWDELAVAAAGDTEDADSSRGALELFYRLARTSDDPADNTNVINSSVSAGQ